MAKQSRAQFWSRFKNELNVYLKLLCMGRVLTSRIAYLLQADPKARILAVTFTRKAANEMQQRLEQLLKTNPLGGTPLEADLTMECSDGEIQEEEFSDGSKSPTYVRDLTRTTIGTFHKVCADILRYNGKTLMSLPSIQQQVVGLRNATLLDGSFTIMDQTDQLRIMKECLVDLSIDITKFSGGVKPLNILNALGDMKQSTLMGGEESKPKKPVPAHQQVAMKIFGLYREKMLTNNLLDFDDLIYLTRELLMVNQVVRQQIHRRWTHILVVRMQLGSTHSERL
jgi:superfamily I DNA/RNA helicase